MVYRSIISTLCLVLPAALAHHSTAYDYIIVGGGTAGLTLASRLTEDSKVTVCVLEAGGDPNITDLRNRYLPFGTPIDWALDTLPQKSAGGRVYTHRQGKVLGGSSAINGAVYLRPDVREYTAMEALGAKGWTWDKFLPYYKKGEAFTVDSDPLLDGLDPSYSGTDGPVQVSFASNISDFFASYAIPSIRAMNGTLNPDNSDGTPVGATPQQLASTAYPGTYNRSYSANAYCELTRNFPVMRRSNLVVHTDSLVSRIIWDHDSHGLSVASGVEYLSSDGTNNTLGKNVLVSAGTLNTPKVLELSGIGDPSLLSNLGIRVKVNNSGVGKNLQNQLGVNVIYALRNDTNVTAGAETQAPLIALLTAQNVLSKDDLAISDSLLQVKVLWDPTSTGHVPQPLQNDGISQAQFDTLKKYISHGIAQTEMDWSLVKGTDGSLSLQFYTTDLHTFSRGYSVR
ncbi:GMC oxidoreductase-domain-containing protein [Mycena latifolia]|nr:GMC oxidoreductase-domain-containing protein [Mycena latifolia]